MMKKKVFFLLFLLLSTSVLMDGCGSQESSAPSQEAENKKVSGLRRKTAK